MGRGRVEERSATDFGCVHLVSLKPATRAQSSFEKNRLKRGCNPCVVSAEAITSVARPTIYARGMKPKKRESRLLSRLSPIMK